MQHQIQQEQRADLYGMTFLDYYARCSFAIAKQKNDAFGNNRVVPKVPESDAAIVAITDFRSIDGRPYTFLEGHPEPMRGWFQADIGNVAFALKKAIPYGAGIALRVNLIKKLAFLLISKDLFNAYIEITYSALMHYGCMRNVENLSEPVAEIYRAMLPYGEKETSVFCQFIELDMAYRYRTQDILSAVDKKLLAKNPRKEILRLMDVLLRRDAADELMTAKWQAIKFVLTIFLLVNRKVLKNIQTVLLGLDLDKVKFSKEDRYWTSQLVYKNYNFEDKPIDERQKYLETYKKRINYETRRI